MDCLWGFDIYINEVCVAVFIIPPPHSLFCPLLLKDENNEACNAWILIRMKQFEVQAEYGEGEGEFCVVLHPWRP